MDTKQIVLELLGLFCLLKDDRHAALVKAAALRLEEQADTIERLAKESDEFREERDMAMSELEPLVEQAERLQQERDAALAEVKRQRNIIGGVSAQSQDEIDRLTVMANNNAASHAKCAEKLADAYAEVARLKVMVDELREGFDAEQAGIEFRRAMDRMGR